MRMIKNTLFKLVFGSETESMQLTVSIKGTEAELKALQKKITELV